MSIFAESKTIANIIRERDCIRAMLKPMEIKWVTWSLPRNGFEEWRRFSGWKYRAADHFPLFQNDPLSKFAKALDRIILIADPGARGMYGVPLLTARDTIVLGLTVLEIIRIQFL
jgi:hypothetical protein